MKTMTLSLKWVGILGAALAITLSARMAMSGGGSGEGDGALTVCEDLCEGNSSVSVPLYQGEVILEKGVDPTGTLGAVYFYTKKGNPIEQIDLLNKLKPKCKISLPSPAQSPSALYFLSDAELSTLSAENLKGLCIRAFILQEFASNCTFVDFATLETFEAVDLQPADKSATTYKAKILFITRQPPSN